MDSSPPSPRRKALFTAHIVAFAGLPVAFGLGLFGVASFVLAAQIGGASAILSGLLGILAGRNLVRVRAYEKIEQGLETEREREGLARGNAVWVGLLQFAVGLGLFALAYAASRR